MAWRRLDTLAALCGVLALLSCSSDATKNRHIRYMAVGASDAVGVGATPLSNGYVFQIRDALERGRDVDLLNLGIPGANVSAILQAVHVALRAGARPDLVTIWVGANDVIDGVDADDFEDDLDEMLEEIEDRTKSDIVIADIPDLTQLPRFRDHPVRSVTRERIEDFNDAIADQAQDHDASLVRLSEEEVEERFVSDADGFHPNDRGHRRIAELFLRQIRPLLAWLAEGSPAPL